jgi:hypothetical protein
LLGISNSNSVSDNKILLSLIGFEAGTTSTSHSSTNISVPVPEPKISVFILDTQNSVHLTAAVESVVYISNSDSSFKLVALVQIVPAHRANLTKVVKLSLLGKSNSFRTRIDSLAESHNIAVEPSEK